MQYKYINEFIYNSLVKKIEKCVFTLLVLIYELNF